MSQPALHFGSSLVYRPKPQSQPSATSASRHLSSSSTTTRCRGQVSASPSTKRPRAPRAPREGEQTGSKTSSTRRQLQANRRLFTQLEKFLMGDPGKGLKLPDGPLLNMTTMRRVLRALRTGGKNGKGGGSEMIEPARMVEMLEKAYELRANMRRGGRNSDTLWSRVRASLPWAVVLSIQDLRSLGLGLVDAAALFTKTHARGVRGGIGAIAAAAQKLHGAMTEHEKRRVRIPRGINIFQVPAHTEAGEPLHGDVQRALFPIQQTQINGGRLGLTALEERLCRAWLDQNGRSDKDAIVPLEHLNAIRARARELEAGAQTGDGY